MGYSKSQHMLSLMYWRGLGVTKDKNKAFYWSNESANQNYYHAQITLAKFYLEGVGTQTYQSKAYEYYLKALKNSKATSLQEAYEGLGLCYEKGYGIGKDAKKAIEYYSKLSCEYIKLIKIAKVHYGVLSDYKEALKLALDAYKLAKEHDPRGEIGCFLGKLYYHGHGVNQNYDKSFEYFKEGFKKSFRDGYDDVEPELNYYIGLSFVNGYGTEKNLEKGKEYLIKAEEKNFASATYALYDISRGFKRGK